MIHIIKHINTWCWGKSIYIIVNGGEGIVTISFTNEDPENATITGLSVIPEARNKGLGNKLIELAEAEAMVDERVKNITIDADENEFTFNWYKRLGYKQNNRVWYFECPQVKELVKKIR